MGQNGSLSFVYTTLIFLKHCIAGECLPPFIVYKGLNLYENWTFDEPTDAQYTLTHSGWMHGVSFEIWLTKVFAPFTESNLKPVRLLYGGPSSYFTFNTVKVARENNIIIMFAITYQPCTTASRCCCVKTIEDGMKEDDESQIKSVNKASSLPC